MNNKIYLAFKLRNLFIIPKFYSSSAENNLTVEGVTKENVSNHLSNNKEKNESINTILEPCKEDLSSITPALVPSFNLASYVNKSTSLQEFVKLGVDISKLEKRRFASELILGLDFKKDVEKYICCLNDFGVPAESLGHFFTKNPFIFNQDIEDLSVRYRYLESKNFSANMIADIITKQPYWLNYSTNSIDSRLGYIQNKFYLNGDEIRSVVTAYPKIVTTTVQQIQANYFSIKEEMGFSKSEIKFLFLKRPKLWTIRQKQLVSRFDYLHNTMGISHQQILDHPQTLANRLFRTQDRHEFLVHLGRAQYDPKKEGYISPERLVTDSDQNFAIDVAKSSEHTYINFLKNK